jgi:hypothetical protein
LSSSRSRAATSNCSSRAAESICSFIVAIMSASSLRGSPWTSIDPAFFFALVRDDSPGTGDLPRDCCRPDPPSSSVDSVSSAAA